MPKFVLFKEKRDCCGCGTCAISCPQNSITMNEDEYGFLYPMIDHNRCIRCGHCLDVCAFQSPVPNNNMQEKAVYAAASKDTEKLIGSASGGIFSVLASNVLERGGAVFGCSMEKKEGKLTPEHIMVERLEELYKLQGSKYVQSNLNTSFVKVKNELKKERIVLFSGTPCQIASLQRYLRKPYKNLITVDIICHGVPSVKFFQDYLQELGRQLKGNISSFFFRSNKCEWGNFTARIFIENKKRKIETHLISSSYSSYYKYFLDSVIYRDSCYFCKYANCNRQGDITLGDYWGIEIEHSELLKSGTLDKSKGISCILVNSQNGTKAINSITSEIVLCPSTFSKVARHNEQLQKPSELNKKRAEIFKAYQHYGYRKVEQIFNHELGYKKYIHKIWEYIPHNLQTLIKKGYTKS